MKWTEDRLARWAIYQRTCYSKGTLSPEKIKLLEAIPGWTWEPLETEWKKRYDETLKYGLVIVTFKTPEGYPLGVWQGTQRAYCKNPERRKLLEAIPGWHWRKGIPNEDKINKRIEELKTYYEKHGTFPTQFESTGRWLSIQRRNHKKNPAKFATTPQYPLLEAITPTWKDPAPRTQRVRGFGQTEDHWVDTITSFFKKHNRLPRYSKHEPGAFTIFYEKRLVTRGKPTFRPKLQKCLDELDPTWRLPSKRGRKGVLGDQID